MSTDKLESKIYQKKCITNNQLSKKKQNPKELWKFINSVISSKRSDTPLAPFEIIVNDCSLNNSQKTAQSFNDYFVKIGQSIANSIYETKLLSFKTYMNNFVSQRIVLKVQSPNDIHIISSTL